MQVIAQQTYLVSTSEHSDTFAFASLNAAIRHVKELIAKYDCIVHVYRVVIDNGAINLVEVSHD